ncbi:MAG: hypothetical protein DWQ53_05850 [Microcystis flos-aquae DF17]|uniref:Uncharacterized protein n=1 Tax=Microcystis flos-aquae TF09 TaxID=2060473 RepID=A0A3E0L6Y6_9CHRO|nr:hypothetical protein [Microcystis aeruginosa]REJ42683.1 MAG: hypothetical protein DWQ54_07090 [Microcystis flos-aquae TF09]REJ48462.1 MAG: hypothetical protein DWQ53_05850 [Microcystis flos-aquae DF17]
MISLSYIGSINLCVLCVFVVRYTPSLGGLYLRIHFTHQTQESLGSTSGRFKNLNVAIQFRSQPRTKN